MIHPDLFGAPLAYAQFEEWYARYPRHDGRRAALAAFGKALRRTTFDVLMRGLELYQFSPERRFQPMPATWLNRDDWDVVNYAHEVSRPASGPAGKTAWMDKWDRGVVTINGD